MKQLNLYTNYASATTTVSNTFIEKFMPSANGEFVKVYLYLLCCVTNSRTVLSVSELADFFNQTETDIIRALKYWDKLDVLKLSMNDDGTEVTAITFCDPDSASGKNSNPAPSSDTSNVPLKSQEKAHEELSPIYIETRTAYTPQRIKELRSQDEFSMLLYAAGTYLGGELNPSDASTIAYLYDTLHFPADLVEYLIEYCVTNGHRSMRYIEKVALAWSQQGISSVKEARFATSTHKDATFSVLGAFGIKGRTAGKQEQEYIDKWTDTYCFDSDIIVEACNRTMKATHQPSFEYADSILKRWKEANVKSASDIQKMDAEYEAAIKNSKRYSNSTKTNNRFNNFHQRNNEIDEASLISNNG